MKNSARAIAVGIWAASFVCGSGVGPAAADLSEPAQVLQEKIDHTLAIIRDTAHQKKSSVPKLRQNLIEELEPLFIFREMTVRALGSHARGLSSDRIDTLSRSFKRLLERVYIDRLTAHLVDAETPYSIEDIQISGQERRGGYARINTKARIRKKTEETELLMNYRMVKREGSWYVYDLEIEGVSLIENYRNQFNEILTNKSFDDLVQSIDQNVASLEKEQAAKLKESDRTPKPMRAKKSKGSEK